MYFRRLNKIEFNHFRTIGDKETKRKKGEIESWMALIFWEY